MPVPDGNQRRDKVIFFVAYKTSDDATTIGNLGVFNSLTEAASAVELMTDEQLTWEFYGDGQGDMWFAETDDGTMYTIHAAGRSKLDL